MIKRLIPTKVNNEEEKKHTLCHIYQVNSSPFDFMGCFYFVAGVCLHVDCTRNAFTFTLEN